MEYDIRQFSELGVDGVVIGVLNSSGALCRVALEVYDLYTYQVFLL